MKLHLPVAAAALCLTVHAQQSPALQSCGEIRDAGTLHLVSGVLVPPNSAPEFQPGLVTEGVIYDNTCDQYAYFPLLSGNSLIDEGRVPSTTSPAPNTGTLNKYRVTKFQIAYCTRTASPAFGGTGAAVTVKFYDSYAACTPSSANPPPVATFALTGLPALDGSLACYTLTIDLTGGAEFYLSADGNGVFEGAGDLFGFSYELPGEPIVSSYPGGVLGAGDLVAPGACGAGTATYYNTPGAPQGTGLGNANFCYAEGTNSGQPNNLCLVFGFGYHTGLHMKIYGDLADCNGNAMPDAFDISSGGSLDTNTNGVPDECECLNVGASYCTAGVSNNSCSPVVSGSGSPSASAASGYVVTCSGMDGLRPSGMFYGLGAAANPINAGGGGTSFYCTTSPRQRLITPMPNTGGTAGACDGAISVDLNAWLSTHPSGLGSPFGAGQTLYVQAFNRDNGNPSKGLVFSGGLAVTLCP